MATVPSPATFTTGEVVTAAKLNTEIRDAVNFILNPPQVRLYLTANQSTASTTVTVLSGWTELRDSDAMYAAGSPTRITFNTSGVYQVSFGIRYANNTTGYRAALIRHNDTSDIHNVYHGPSPAIGTTANSSFMHYFAAGDYITLAARQSSGVALDVLGGVDDYTFFQARWVAVS